MKAPIFLALGLVSGIALTLALRPSAPELGRGSPTPQPSAGGDPHAAPRSPANPRPESGRPAEAIPPRSSGQESPSALSSGGGIRLLVPREEKERAGQERDRMVTREELALRAATVEDEANRRLERWTRELNLTDDQQARAFSILARASVAYHPALRVEEDIDDPGTNDGNGGAAPAVPGEAVKAPRSVEGQLQEILDPAQQIAFEDDLAASTLWWNDVIGYLEADLDAEAAAAAARPVPEPSDYRGDELSELFGN